MKARPASAAAGLERFLGALDLDALCREEPRQPRARDGSLPGAMMYSRVPFCPSANGAAPILEVVAQQPLAVAAPR